MKKRKNTIPQTNQSTKEVKITKAEFYSGPIPTPEDLAKYNTIESSFAERILRMVEKDQENSDRIQNRRSTFGFLVTSAGLLFAAGTIAGLIYALIVSIQLGMEAVAASIVVSMAGVAGVFVFRNK